MGTNKYFSFRIARDGEFVTSGPVFKLFRDVNPVMAVLSLQIKYSEREVKD
ncbi:MAG: hypothetical protein U9N32_04540 [Spirochaetota bacterium]|nr:hypothetical protein [Spirochaetota bacterium]